jgi:hypothetical protein
MSQITDCWFHLAISLKDDFCPLLSSMGFWVLVDSVHDPLQIHSLVVPYHYICTGRTRTWLNLIAFSLTFWRKCTIQFSYTRSGSFITDDQDVLIQEQWPSSLAYSHPLKGHSPWPRPHTRRNQWQNSIPLKPHTIAVLSEQIVRRYKRFHIEYLFSRRIVLLTPHDPRVATIGHKNTTATWLGVWLD